MRKTFPAFAKSTAPDAQDHATLVLAQSGWHVPE
jgi:hypothetical protein